MKSTNNQWAIAIMLRPRILMQRAMVTVDRMETVLRSKGMAWIRSRRGFVTYKMSRRVSLLEEIADTLDRVGIPHCVTGGFAYDALRGAVTRYHADVDFALLGEHANAAIAALEAHGLDVTSHSMFKAVAARGDLHADLFLWQDVGDGKVEMMLPSDTGIVEVQIPREFVSLSVQVELMGLRFRIAGKQYMVSILPFVHDEKDRELISSLDTGDPLRFEESVGRVEMRTRRFEFRDGGASPHFPDGPG